MVGRILVEVFRGAVESGTELNVEEVMQPVRKVVKDADPTVRLDLVEQLPHVAMICQEAPDRLGDVVPGHLIKIIVRFLRDVDQQVRQSTHAALLALIDRGLLDKYSAEHVVAPTLLWMCDQRERQELHTLAIDGMSKVARILDVATAERLFLYTYIALCKDSNFLIRKLCAIRFGEFCAAMGETAIYQKLLPTYLTLCYDKVWSVRKSCADVIVSFACCVSLDHRRAILSEMLANFLTDDSKWVKVSAFQILGPFISTFAKQFTGFSYTQYGELVLTDQHGTELRLSFAGSTEPPPCKTAVTSGNQILQLYEEDGGGGGVSKINSVDSLGNNVSDSNKENVPLSDRITLQCYGGSSALNEKQDVSEKDATIFHDYDQFNPFRYYYISPDLPLDSEIVEAAMGSSESSTTKPVEPVNSASTAARPLAVAEPQQDSQQDPQQDTQQYHQQDNWPQTPDNESESNIKTSVDPSEHSQLAQRLSSPSGSPSGSPSSESTADKDNTTGALPTLLQPKNIEKMDKTEETNNATNDSREEGAPPSRNTSLNDTIDISNISVEQKNAAGANADAASQTPEGQQTIVPYILVNSFVSMADPWAVSIGIEIPRHCAFSFPAVALTLGRENWPLLKEAYAALADAREYRVRRTMASSIHELAMILGEDLAARDLLPIYEGFTKDLDEVRIGALKHLTTFLKVLRPADRRQFLPRLKAFLVMDNEWNWRFREEVAGRLLEAIPLFTPADVSEHIAPLSFPLLTDKVAAVRHAAIALVTQIISYLSNNDYLLSALITELKQMLVSKTSKWTYRQAYALLCSTLISNHAISDERFGRDLLPSLLSLSSDVVPNVRLAVVTALSRHVMDIWDSLGWDLANIVRQTLLQMRTDPDRDVRIVAGGIAGKYFPAGSRVRSS